MIKAENISKNFEGKTAVDSISFEVSEGQTLVLLGTSGCGKTTTLRMVNRLLEPDSGQLFFDGKDIRSYRDYELRRKIGYVIQKTGLFPHYSVNENIAVVPRLLNWEHSKIKSRTKALLEKLHLDPEEYGHQYPSQLSGGQQQRIGLARALISDPSAILMDEPLGALDPITRKSIRKEFRELEELRKKASILVTHDITEAFELGDHICLMDKGKVVDRGSPSELLFKSSESFTKDFLKGQTFHLTLLILTLNDLAKKINYSEKEAESIVDGKVSLQQVFEEHAPQNTRLGLKEFPGKSFLTSDIIEAINKLHE